METDVAQLVREAGVKIEEAIKAAGPSVREGFEEVIKYNAAQADAHVLVGICLLAAGFVALLLFVNALYRAYKTNNDFWVAISVICGIVLLATMLGGIVEISNNYPVSQAPRGYTIKHDLLGRN